MTTQQETVGFVGVGLMGHGIATNILAGGYPLSIICHRNREPVDDLVSQGATEVETLAQMGQRSSVVFVCAPGSPEVEAIVNELAGTMNAGGVIVDCSTSNPVSTEALAGMLSTKGISLADAPLGGTPVQAAAGELGAMVGADDAVFRRLEPLLKTWASSVVHIGGPGDGHKMKLLNNFLSMGYAAIYSEALALGKKVGIGIEQFDSVLRGSRMDCGFYQTFMGYALEGNPESHKFTLTNAYKDMRYLESMAAQAGVANPIGNAIKNSFALAVAAGRNGPEDYVPMLADFIAAINDVNQP